MRHSVRDIQKMTDRGERIPMVTAYDATSARLSEAAGVPLLLVGDSLGMVVQGHADTIPVTLDDIVYHSRIVVRATQKALVVGDLPFMTYSVSTEQALANAARLMQQGGVGAVKLEGGVPFAPTIAAIVGAGIPVMAHIGLTPQSVNRFGGFRVQGRERDSARRILDDALAVEAAGAFAVVLELVPIELAQLISDRLHIPTIGIGAGPGCDGQVQVWHDLLGLFDGLAPRHAKHYAEAGALIRDALAAYADEVRAGTFPTAAHAVSLDADVLAALTAADEDDD